MMNKIVEAVAKGQEVDKKELFNSVNDFELTRGWTDYYVYAV